MHENHEVNLPPYVVNEVGPVMSLTQTNDWGIDRLLIPKIHAAGITGKGIRIAVIDTGVENHADLQGAVIKRLKTVTEAYASTNGHGTGVAGVIAARNNAAGVVGVAYNSEIISIKALDESGSGSLSAIASAINVAVAEGAHIINMSLGSSATSKVLESAISNATSKGVFVVCAAGNDGTDNSVNYPARYIPTYAVGAINQDGKISSFSSRGWDVDIAAPGERILTTWRGNTYAKVSGTSFAAPYVSGIFALLLEAKVPITHLLLEKTAIDIEEPGLDVKSGHGLINPARIINENTTPTPPVVPPVYDPRIVEAYSLLKSYLNIV